MPAVPIYNPQVNVPGQAAGVPNFTGLGTPFAQSVSQVGRMLQHRGERLVQEYDQTKALSAFNAYRNEARTKLIDLHSREGMSAYGIQDEFKQWDADARKRIIKDSLPVHSQEQMFTEIADRRAAADLDSLASHEMRQHAVVKKETIEGLEGNTLADIRADADNESVYQDLKGGYQYHLNEMFPGHDHSADVQKFSQKARYEQVDELINRSPAAALKKIEEPAVRAELGKLYGPLKNKLDHELKENQMTIAYETVKRQTNSNPFRAIQMLDSIDYTSGQKWDAATVARLRNVFEGEIRWAKFMQDEGRREKSITVMAGVNQALAAGNPAEAERIFAGADFLNPFDANQIRNVIDSRISKYTDSSKFDALKKGIKDGSVTHENQIEMHKNRGLSTQDTALLVQTLKDERDDPNRAQAINDAMSWFDKEFNTKKDLRFAKMRPQVEAYLRDHVLSENIKGAQNILQSLIEYTGTKDDVKYKFYFFGEPSTEKPMGRAMEADKAMREGAGKPFAGGASQPSGEGRATPRGAIRTPESVMAGSVPSAEHIPANIREKIGRILDAAGKAKTEKNYIEVYTRNRDKLMGGQ